MERNINQVGPAEYELEIRATADELAPQIDKEIRQQRGRVQLKGFRPGTVPVQIVKKMYGRAIAYGVAEQTVQKEYEDYLEVSDFEVLGRPTITELEYDLDQDLRAIVRFGVRPQFDLADTSTEKVARLVHQVDDEEIDKEIERRRLKEADLIPSDDPVGEQDYVRLDIQRLDDATKTPVIGQRDEDVDVFMDDQSLREELRKGLAGKQAGDVFRVDIVHEGAHHHDEPTSELLELPGQHHHEAHSHTHAYEVTVKEVKRRELPELDEELIKRLTEDRASDEAGLREDIRNELQRSWDRYAEEFLNDSIVDRMLALNPIPVPPSVADVYLDSFVEDVKRRNKNKLPEGFDEEAFRQANRGEAEKQAQWALIRDKVMKEEGIDVTDEDVDAYFGKAASAEEGVQPDLLKQLYAQMPGLIDQLKQRLLSEKVFKSLEGRFTVEEKNREELEKDIAEQSAAAEPSRIIT